MAVSDLDPLFVKGLRLLHSKSKDSADQLKMLLDDLIAQSKQSAHSKERIYTSVKLEGESKISIKKAPRDPTEASSYSSKHSLSDNWEKKVEKRPFEKMKQDSPEGFHEAKIPKLESPQVYAYYPSSPDPPKLDQYVMKGEEDTDSSDENADADEVAMGMGLACVICNQIDVTQGNQLIECQECHSLYHQECHRPPASDYDVNDPRRIWYCAKCVKNMKKMATKTQKTAKSVVTVVPKEPVSQAKSVKVESSPPSLMLPFKRAELKPSISQGNTTQAPANKPIGLAGLAANFGGRTTTSTVSSTSNPSARPLKTPAVPIGAKSQGSFSAASTAKTPLSGSTALLSKTPSSTFQTLSSTTTTSLSASSAQKASTTSSVTKGLGLLSSAAATASNRGASSSQSGNGNSGHKVPSCSPLMSADKRLQIMKKKASKLQEKRRLSSK
ncbi:integrator complex subunit 12-like [Uloborus diversus]|uniref:integrator complex subunit 12-like n=1 Tax=Uloborus diversus TaxID=327109 RepID=UPI00240A0E44|nr:integrator complex subunit 12-like [Uloborus diversus]